MDDQLVQHSNKPLHLMAQDQERRPEITKEDYFDERITTISKKVQKLIDAAQEQRNIREKIQTFAIIFLLGTIGIGLFQRDLNALLRAHLKSPVW